MSANVRQGFKLFGGIWNAHHAQSLVAGRQAATIDVKPLAQRFLTRTPITLRDGRKAVPSGQAWVVVDEQKALSAQTDLSVPVIALRSPPGLQLTKGRPVDVSVLVIDGWHRIYKAWKHDIVQLPCHYLTATEEATVRIA